MRLFLATLFIAQFLIAQDRGRLPDGRAFRTDTDGNQVVDYIAELETTVDALTQQIIALEDKLAGATCPKCPEQVIQEPVSCEAEINLAVQQALERSSSEISRVEKTANESRKEIELLRAELERERTRARALDSQVSSLRASMRAPEELSITSPVVLNRSEPNVSPALVSLRGTVLTEINRLKGRLSKRDALFKGGNVSAGVVKIKSTEARTNTGKTLDDLRVEASASKTLRELADIRRGLYQIREIIESDIRDAERLIR
jgi:hypothetical protein